MRILLCIDDTDDLEKGKGTGTLAEGIAGMIEKRGWGTCGKVTRHQLLLHEAIPYTSHNSSMCFEAEIEEKYFQAVIDGAAAYLVRERADASDPGLCVAAADKLVQPERLVDFGIRAKNVVLNKEQAYALAQELNIHLSEHGGTGQGVIGALAGAGLRLSGNDGEFKGALDLPASHEVRTVTDLCKTGIVDMVMDTNGCVLAGDEKIITACKTKTVLLQGKAVLLAANYQDSVPEQVYVACNKEQIRRFGMFRRNEQGQREFCGGLENENLAAAVAATCEKFSEDVEEEQVAESNKSCYNCRFRRWTAKTFICCSPE